MIYLIIALLTVWNSAYAEVNPIPGENLWRLTARIGQCLDVTSSFLPIIISELDVAISITDPLISEISKLESVVDSLLDPLASQLDSIGDILSSKLTVIEKEVLSAIDLVTALDPLFPSIGDLFLSILSEIDLHLESIAETILDTISVVDFSLSSQIEALAMCEIGTPIHQTDIPYVISAPGLYTVCEDLTLTTGTGSIIQILSDDVTLDLHGYTLFTGDAIVGLSIGDPLGVTLIQSVVVRNGTVQAANTSTVPNVSVGYTTDLALASITTINGPDIHQSFGSGCASVLLEGCSCIGNNGFVLDVTAGAFDFNPAVGSITSIIVRNSSVAAPLNHGMRFASVADILVTDTVITDTPALCFQIENVASAVVCEHCVANGNNVNSRGFNIDNGTTTLRWCTAQANGDTGYFITVDSTGSLFVECVAQDNSNGFRIFGSNAVLKRCSVVQNSNIGIYVDTFVTNTQIFDTCPVNNTIDYINLGTDTVFINLETALEILCSKIEHAESVLSEEISILDETIISVGDLILSGLESVLDFACLTGTVIKQANVNAGPFIIAQPGVYTVCEDLTNSTDLIHIMANNVTLDLNGHTLTSSAGSCIVIGSVATINVNNGACSAPAAAAINGAAGGSDITVENVTVFGSAEPGITFLGSSDITIKNCAMNDTSGTVVGAGMISLLGCDSALIEDCTVVGITNQPLEGVVVIDPQAGGTTIRRCTVQAVQQIGFDVEVITGGSLDICVLEDCIAADILTGPVSVGYYMFDFVTGTTGGQFSNCIAESCIVGFLIDTTQGVFCERCVSRYNSDPGFLIATFQGITPPTNAFLENCVAHNNATDGFAIGGNAATLRMCKAISNTDIGFNITGTTTVVEKSLASNNGGSGIDNSSGTGTVLVDNRSSNGATSLNPAYSLNGAPDVNGTATIITLS